MDKCKHCDIACMSSKARLTWNSGHLQMSTVMLIIIFRMRKTVLKCLAITVVGWCAVSIIQSKFVFCIDLLNWLWVRKRVFRKIDYSLQLHFQISYIKALFLYNALTHEIWNNRKFALSFLCNINTCIFFFCLFESLFGWPGSLTQL